MLENYEWMSVSEAAEELNLSIGRVHQILREDNSRLQATKLNAKAWAISRKSLEKFKQLKRPPGNPNFLK